MQLQDANLTPSIGGFGLSQPAQAAEQAREEKRTRDSSDTGHEGIPAVFVEIGMENATATEELRKWLVSKGIAPVSLSGDFRHKIYENVVGIYVVSEKSAGVILPADLLIPISQRDGFKYADNGCWAFPFGCHPN